MSQMGKDASNAPWILVNVRVFSYSRWVADCGRSRKESADKTFGLVISNQNLLFLGT